MAGPVQSWELRIVELHCVALSASLAFCVACNIPQLSLLLGSRPRVYLGRRSYLSCRYIPSYRHLPGSRDYSPPKRLRLRTSLSILPLLELRVLSTFLTKSQSRIDVPVVAYGSQPVAQYTPLFSFSIHEPRGSANSSRPLLVTEWPRPYLDYLMALGCSSENRLISSVLPLLSSWRSQANAFHGRKFSCH